jgi:hypothetical protein
MTHGDVDSRAAGGSNVNLTPSPHANQGMTPLSASPSPSGELGYGEVIGGGQPSGKKPVSLVPKTIKKGRVERIIGYREYY